MITNESKSDELCKLKQTKTAIIGDVEQLLVDYCDAVDSRNWPLLYEKVFVTNAIFYYTIFGLKIELSRVGKASWLKTLTKIFSFTSHFVSNVNVRFPDGVTTKELEDGCEIYATAKVIDTQQFFFFSNFICGVYQLRLSKVNGCWKCTEFCFQHGVAGPRITFEMIALGIGAGTIYWLSSF